MEQLTMFADDQVTEEADDAPLPTTERYMIHRGTLWWDGRVWTEDQHMAIGLHGDVVLQREIETYLQGVEITITTG